MRKGKADIGSYVFFTFSEFRTILKLHDFFQTYSHAEWEIANGLIFPSAGVFLFCPLLEVVVDHYLSGCNYAGRVSAICTLYVDCAVGCVFS